MSTITRPAANSAQLDDIRYLLTQLESRGYDLTGTRKAMNDAWLAHSFDVDNAADMIKMLLDACDGHIAGQTVPQQRTAGQFASVPAGRYAVLNDAGEYAFYRVRITGGIHVVDQQLSTTFHPVSRATAAAVLHKIAANPQQACTDYGLKLEICGRCGIALTNPESRARGMGDICASKGW